MIWDNILDKVNSEELLSKVNSLESFCYDNVSIKYLGKVDTPENLHYGTRSGYYFSVEDENNEFSIDKTYLLYFIKDSIQKKSFKAHHNGEYFGFEFMYNLLMSRETLTGLDRYKSMIKNLKKAISESPICIEGNNNEFIETTQFIFKRYYKI